MLAVNSSVEPKGNGNELVYGETVPSSSDRCSDVDVQYAALGRAMWTGGKEPLMYLSRGSLSGLPAWSSRLPSRWLLIGVRSGSSSLKGRGSTISWSSTTGVLGTVGAIGEFGTVDMVRVFGTIGATRVLGPSLSTSIAPTLGVSGEPWGGILALLCMDKGVSKVKGEEVLM